MILEMFLSQIIIPLNIKYMLKRKKVFTISSYVLLIFISIQFKLGNIFGYFLIKKYFKQILICKHIFSCAIGFSDLKQLVLYDLTQRNQYLICLIA